MRGCFRVVGVLTLLVILACGAAFWFLTRQPAATRQLTPVVVSSAAVVSFDQKIATVQAAKGPVTVEVTQDEATSKLVAALKNESDPTISQIEDPQLRFQRDRFIASGVVHSGPIPVTVAVTGKVTVVNGKLVATVEEIDTGQVPLPAPLRQRIIDLVSDTDNLTTDLPDNITDVQIQEGKLIVTGVPR